MSEQLNYSRKHRGTHFRGPSLPLLQTDPVTSGSWSKQGVEVYRWAKLQEDREVQAVVQRNEKDERDLEELRRELFARLGRGKGASMIGD
jgi:hypothetical protein